MLHPSYTEIIDAVNSEVEPGEQPVVQSRYSIVIATAKRARQLIAGEVAEVPRLRQADLFLSFLPQQFLPFLPLI